MKSRNSSSVQALSLHTLKFVSSLKVETLSSGNGSVTPVIANDVYNILSTNDAKNHATEMTLYQKCLEIDLDIEYEKLRSQDKIKCENEK
jgi:hypothetical protein